ncbi:COX15/CtaA family protein [Demequina mangrovi]|uniref:Cytochrome c oxidase assembly protein subunit 15 n=1 Tax=Demequina mangrovi TaxID=1043493 RepID=A0A1H7B670_9MICO|nr:COX15/CtaA family protein [Demequina mangrovi]SEJ69952.1 cytochrome c oxidase assembly protein subunit 15 [Demequina mangrovi]
MSTTEQPPVAPSPARGVRGLPGRVGDAIGRRTRGLTLLNIGTQAGIIVTGGAVRLTGSGLGCSTWPQCEPGSFTPEFHEGLWFHPAVEFGNRTLTFVLLVVAALLAIGVWRTRRDLRWWGLVPLAGVLGQAVLGGITVLVELHPLVVAPHMLLSLALVWYSVRFALRYRDARGRLGGPLVIERWASAALLVVLLVLGALTTGAGPHSGDAEATERLALDPALIARAHAMAVWAFIALLVWIGWRIRRDRSADDRDEARLSFWVLAGVTLAQGAIGYVQYFTGLPALIVGAHLLGAAVLTAAHSAFFRLTARDTAA